MNAFLKKLLPAVAMLLCVGLAIAEDIDVYVDNAATSGVPNVLFVIDNGANFEASGGSTPCTAYSDGSGDVPSLGSSNGGIQQCALVNAISSLPNGTVNIGLLVGNANNFAKGYSGMVSTDAAYYNVCDQSTGYGGCVIRPLTFMDATGKTNLIRFIKSWKTSGSDSATSFVVKAGGNKTANMMQEAWAYYNGKVGMSGRSYSSSLLAAGCQKNFVLFIANAAGSSSTPADTPAGADAGAALAASQVGASTDQKAQITTTINPTVCTSDNSFKASDWQPNWADEWARMMYQQDGGATDAVGAQNIISYGIGVVGTNCKKAYPALLTSVAKQGGGQYFSASGSADLTAAIGAVLNEVQAVNSVFSSASLPVSVNAQGTYLNQVFLGMFRPDSGAGPRWMGNLKQYQFVYNSAGALVLGDAAGSPAISSGNTGFISPNAASFWSTKTGADDASNVKGFFVNNPMGTPLSGFNSPDGEIVEKGGTAQQLRIENLSATFSNNSTTNNPRRLYTYCPSGTGCKLDLTDSTNQFLVGNSGIAANAFGDSTTVNITSIVRTGTNVVVTTQSTHGFAAGAVVTISNATPSDYNGDVTVLSSGLTSNTFSYTLNKDYPTTPAQGAYTISVPQNSVVLSGLSRNASNTNTATATALVSGGHAFTNGSQVQISGATSAPYNGTFTIAVPNTGTCPAATCFTYSVPVTPNATASGFTATLAISNIATNSGVTPATVTLLNPHGWTNGTTRTVVIGGTNNNKFDGTQTITITGANTFTFAFTGNKVANYTGPNGTVGPATNSLALTRTEATAGSATGTATGATANFFGAAVGIQRIVTLSKASVSAAESGYAGVVTITCSDATCTQFTFQVPTVSPAGTPSGTISASIAGTTVSQTLAAGKLTRAGSGDMVTVSGLTSGLFGNAGSVRTVNVAVSGTAYPDETAYTGNWTLTCGADAGCTTATFGPVTQTPTPNATGVSMQAYSSSSPPDRDTVVAWLRGKDPLDGSEKGPAGSVTVRPSIHGDVLHSRPVVVNYGDSRGLVVFYGANDGVFRAVNGSQDTAIGTVPAGGELWGLVLPEHYGQIDRLRNNSPELRFPSTTLASAQNKDYFVDGPTGVYQKLTSTGVIDKAYIYLTMRRGGRFIYALDVSTPTTPKVLWKISNSTAGFEELGQTWSRPRLTLVPGYADPVLIFGAGYSPNEDSEPPVQANMGRGIYVVDAATGALVWSAVKSCNASTTTASNCLSVGTMDYSVPSEIAFVDRDNNGKTDKLYFGDMGGNLWRVDVNASLTANWTVTKLASLGCANGPCGFTSGVATTTPRKFFFPPAVLSVGVPGGSNPSPFDAVMLGSGDREHPLRNTATGSAYNVTNRFYMIKDTAVTAGTPGSYGVSPYTNGVVETQSGSSYGLVNASASVTSDATTNYKFDTADAREGFYITFATGEKAVNAPLVVFGTTYFGTNKPTDPSAQCAANLGEARGYAVDPFTGTKTSSVYPGGGLPPSPVTGLVSVTSSDGKSTVLEKFCIGCGGGSGTDGGSGGSPCLSALENCALPQKPKPNPRRTYFYKR